MRSLSKLAAAAVATTMALGAASSASAADWRHEQPRGYTDHYETPRDAQYRYGNYDFRRDRAMRERIMALRYDIDRAAARGMISRNEARGLRIEADRATSMYFSLSRNGFDRSEVRALQDRINYVRYGLRMEKIDFNNHRY